MRTAVDRFKTLLGATLGLLAGVVVRYASAVALRGGGWHFSTVARRAWLHVHPGVVAAVVAALASSAWLYASWFDPLFKGPALVRGSKFGAIAWTWCALAVASAGYWPIGRITVAHPVQTSLELLAACLAFGVVLGLVHGAGRCRDEYRHGLGYGLPDRRSLG